MIEVRQTGAFRKWYQTLQDRRAAKKIAQRITRIEAGLMGDAKYFDGIGELKIDFGPGYRVYFVQRGSVIIVWRRQVLASAGHQSRQGIGRGALNGFRNLSIRPS